MGNPIYNVCATMALILVSTGLFLLVKPLDERERRERRRRPPGKR